MRQAELKDFGRRSQLGTEAIANPNLDTQTTHHRFDFRSSAGRNDRVIDACVADVDPMPPILRLDAGTGFIALDDLSSDNLFFDFFGDRLGCLPGALENLSHGAFTQLDAMQVAHRLDDSFITQMLR